MKPQWSCEPLHQSSIRQYANSGRSPSRCCLHKTYRPGVKAARALCILWDGGVPMSIPTAELRTARVDRILVIEHDKALQKIIRRAIVSARYEVELVSNEASGLELVRPKTPSGLIIDLQFPGSRGWDLCRTHATRVRQMTLKIRISARHSVLCDRKHFTFIGLHFGISRARHELDDLENH